MNNTSKNKILFYAYVYLGSGLEHMCIPFELELESGEDETSLCYDTVYEAALDAAAKKFSYNDFPSMDINRITISMDSAEYPVIPEDDLEGYKNTEKHAKKVLVLPYATYSLSPEFKIYLEMKEKGLVDFEFDIDKMKSIMDIVGNNMCQG